MPGIGAARDLYVGPATDGAGRTLDHCCHPVGEAASAAVTVWQIGSEVIIVEVSKGVPTPAQAARIRSFLHYPSSGIEAVLGSRASPPRHSSDLSKTTNAS
jgi:hypothetical protein